MACVRTEPSVGKGLWTHRTQPGVGHGHRTHRTQSPGWSGQDATLPYLTQATFLLMLVGWRGRVGKEKVEWRVVLHGGGKGEMDGDDGATVLFWPLGWRVLVLGKEICGGATNEEVGGMGKGGEEVWEQGRGDGGED